MYPEDAAEVTLTTGPYAELIAEFQQCEIPIPGLVSLLKRKRALGGAVEAMTQTLLRGPSELSLSLRELIAATAAKRAGAFELLALHAAVAADVSGDRAVVAHSLDDLNSAPLPPAEKLLLQIADAVVQQRRSPEPQECEQLMEAGWSADAVFDTLGICALMQFLGAWMLYNGAGESPPGAHEIWAAWVARHGYLPEAEHR